MTHMMRMAAVVGVLATAVLADPPHIVIESVEFLPQFPGYDTVYATCVNRHGDFGGYLSDSSRREFEFINNQPHAGMSNAYATAINDALVTVGQSSVGNPRGWVRNGFSLVVLEPNLSFLGVNNAGCILGRTEPRFGNSVYFSREEAGETTLPASVFWLKIDDEGTVYGKPFGSGGVVRKTRSGAVQNLGSFDRDFVSLLHVNSHGDIAGFTETAGGSSPSEGLAVVGGVVHHIQSVTGRPSNALAVMLDGQVIGQESGCLPLCRTKFWVLKSGVRYDLATEIRNSLGFEPDFVQPGAANENGWVVTSGYDTRDNSYHLIRVKIQVDIDRDGDGLLDSWEAPDGGIDVNHDGVIDLRLYDLGARPDHKDVFVEVDSGTIAMSNEAVSRVLFAFENAPVENPDGSTGIHLHIQQDESGLPLPESVSIGGNFPEGFEATKAAHFGTVAERADSNSAAILDAKSQVFRYCVLYDGITFPGGGGYVGLAEISGNDFVVDLADRDFHDGFRDIDDQASTFMHELGHTLGLRHGGVADVIDAGGPRSHQGKPNYPSIMNYALTHPMRWSSRFWRLDYSREELGTLHEDSLDESAGIPSAQYRGYSMPYGVGSDLVRTFKLVRLNGTRVDFDGDGTVSGSSEPVSADLNFLPPQARISGTTVASPGDVMHGHNDWANLVYRVVPDSHQTEHDIVLAEGCPTSESLAYLDAAIPVPCDADVNTDGVLDFFDYLDFVEAFASEAAGADFNSDDVVDLFDYLDFVEVFATGC